MRPKKIKECMTVGFRTIIEVILGLCCRIKDVGIFIGFYSLEIIALGSFLFLVFGMIYVGITQQRPREKTDDPNITVKSFTYNGHRYFQVDRGVCHDEGGCPCRNQRKKNEVSR